MKKDNATPEKQSAIDYSMVRASTLSATSCVIDKTPETSKLNIAELRNGKDQVKQNERVKVLPSVETTDNPMASMGPHCIVDATNVTTTHILVRPYETTSDSPDPDVTLSPPNVEDYQAIIISDTKTPDTRESSASRVSAVSN